ncbi:PREDICTED: GATA zinc finger domain-containing protein 14-like [Nicrophorus vespilloides]|uniref:GATA zinc finger domain-containing protein 14-like n=1 Tax=Nicrophorus vespilloides TaxID=110193 RepID=A0ABM1N9U8_NICVS|nr:PREDICTED: GATA zinc finger domain-containing protein 14-like [Nicrophorus vespilloides]
MGSIMDYEFQIINSNSGEVYEDDKTMIMKNVAVHIARRPLLIGKTRKKIWKSQKDQIMEYSIKDVEDHLDKLKAPKSRGKVPEIYTCSKCYRKGHWVQDCLLEKRVKVSSGIPRDAMIPVEGPEVKGAMLTPWGTYAISKAQLDCYTNKEAAIQQYQIPIICNRFDGSEHKDCSNKHIFEDCNTRNIDFINLNSLKYVKINRNSLQTVDDNKENIDINNPHSLKYVKTEKLCESNTENIDCSNPYSLKYVKTEKLCESNTENIDWRNSYSLKYVKTEKLCESNTENIDWSNPYRLQNVRANGFDDNKENIDINNPHSLKYVKTEKLYESNTENVDCSNPHRLQNVKVNTFEDSYQENLYYSNPHWLHNVKVNTFEDSYKENLHCSDPHRLQYVMANIYDDNNNKENMDFNNPQRLEYVKKMKGYSKVRCRRTKMY